LLAGVVAATTGFKVALASTWTLVLLSFAGDIDGKVLFLEPLREPGSFTNPSCTRTAATQHVQVTAHKELRCTACQALVNGCDFEVRVQMLTVHTNW
jgi:hypothetical protein